MRIPNAAAEQHEAYAHLLHADNGHFQHEHPVQLFAHVWRLTAPNPSVMTGAGTNTYIVGDSEVGFWVIDPGSWRQENAAQLSADDAHLQRIMALTQGDIRCIVCTHSHPDHSPAAAPLQAMVCQGGRSKPLIYGMASADTAKAHSFFRPEHGLGHEEVMTLSKGQRLPPRYQLQAIYTPGHAANHLCFFLSQGNGRQLR